MMMTEDVNTMTETDGEEPDGDTNKYTMTEEDAKKVCRDHGEESEARTAGDGRKDREPREHHQREQ
eukprot:10181486-Heterocapsa_arctica.AAC.1